MGSDEIFVSYSRKDRLSADLIAHHLEERGFAVWWDYKLLPGDDFAEEIELYIKRSSAVIVLWSESSTSSRFVKSEARLAQKLTKYIPVSIDGTMPPIGLDQEHVAFLENLSPREKGYVDQLELSIRKKASNTPQKSLPNLDVNAVEATLWAFIKTSGKTEHLVRYLELFGDRGAFASIANKLLTAQDNRYLSSEPISDQSWLPKDSRDLRLSFHIHASTEALIQRLHELTMKGQIVWNTFDNSGGGVRYSTSDCAVCIYKTGKIFALYDKKGRELESVSGETLQSSSTGKEASERIKQILEVAPTNASDATVRLILGDGSGSDEAI